MGKAGKSFLWGTLLGAAAGSVTALLFAPKPGKELRQDVAEGARVVVEKTQAVAGKVSEQSTELYSKAKTATENLVHDVQSACFRPSKDSGQEALVSSFNESDEEDNNSL